MRKHFNQAIELDQIRLTVAHLRLIKENFETGLVPSQEDWAKIKALPKPWGPLFFTALSELRNQGAPLMPSLERMIFSLDEERELILEAKTKSSQAFGQVILSVFLVPFFALALYFLLPGLEENQGLFLSLVAFCLVLGVLAFFWMLLMMEDARYGKIVSFRRSWILSSKLFFERLIADVSCGHPPDLAWNKAVDFMRNQEVDLLQMWGVQLWDPFPAKGISDHHVEESILQFGSEIRRSIQLSLIEGKGSMDRLESIYRNYLFDLKMRISRELQVLPNHCLKPLFILVLPAVMFLLFGSLFISFGVGGL